MANYEVLSHAAIVYLTGLIRDLASVSEGIDDINLRSDGTFSSVMIDTLIKKCLEDANEYTEKLVANLSRLELKLVTNESEITQPNILYLFKPDGATSYNQYVVIEGNKVLLGTCDIDMAQYLKIADASKTYATKTELKAVTDKIGTTKLTTTAQTLTGSIEEVKGIAEQGALLTVTKTQYDQLVAGQTVNIDGKDYTYDSNTYYVVKDDSDSITVTNSISSSSTDSEIATAKAVNDSYHIKTYTTPEQLGLADGCSVSDIFLALPNNSYFECGQNTTKTNVLYNITGVPTNGGLLTICKQTEFRFSIEYKISGGGGLSPNQLYIGQLKGADGSGLEWQRVVTTTVADVNRTTITFTNGTNYTAIGSSSLNYYTVKNGMCYVSLDVSVTSKASEWTTVYTLPKPIATKIDISHSFVDEVGDSYIAYGVWEDGTFKIKKGENGIRYIINFSYPVAES